MTAEVRTNTLDNSLCLRVFLEVDFYKVRIIIFRERSHNGRFTDLSGSFNKQCLVEVVVLPFLQLAYNLTFEHIFSVLLQLYFIIHSALLH